MKITVIGLGYIGLPTSILFAEAGYKVSGYDIDVERVQRINQCDPVINEPELFVRLQAVITSGNFQATTELLPADTFIIAVPTPITATKQADLQAVWSAADALAKVLKMGDLVILESTVPVGTTKKLATLLQSKTGLIAGTDFSVAFSPERVLPGRIFYELKHNARLVGGIDASSGIRAQQLFQRITVTPPTVTDCSTAEMVKLVENSARDTQLAFAYQVADLARAAELDPYQVIKLANLHPRVQILTPTCGVGGHCIAVDPWFLVETFPQQTPLLRLVRELNDQVPTQILALIEQQLQELRQQKVASAAKTDTPATTDQLSPAQSIAHLVMPAGQSSRDTQLPNSQSAAKTTMNTAPVSAQLRVLVLGLAYKANSDDLRESPALKIALALQQRTDIQLTVCDPHIPVTALAKYSFAQLSDFAELKHQFSVGTEFDLIVLLVGHREFQDLVATRSVALPPVLNYCGLDFPNSIPA